MFYEFWQGNHSLLTSGSLCIRLPMVQALVLATLILYHTVLYRYGEDIICCMLNLNDIQKLSFKYTVYFNEGS